MTEIILNFNRHDFEEIYFRNGNDKIFFSPITKSQTNLTLVFVVICSMSLMLSISSSHYWGWFYFLLIILVFITLNLVRKILYLLDWRKSIKDYLDKIEKYKYHKIVLSESAFTLITDTDETIERWSEFKKVEINELSITLWGNEIYLIPSYLIPKKSMTPKDYELLKKEISEKMNNNLA